MRDLTETTTDMRFDGIAIRGKYHFLLAQVSFDPEIDGIGAISMRIELPVAKDSLSGQDLSQLHESLLAWLPQAIREESLREWFKKQADQD